MIEHMSLRNGGPARRQSFKLGASYEEWKLQSYTIQIGLVGEFLLTGWLAI